MRVIVIKGAPEKLEYWHLISNVGKVLLVISV
ncbi:Hypothetical protein LUCI_0111 [Lucifera butyrica]|uniref:Uncharacterized protein n=1 Tax=Lucifera butyrica TaxID=1351585 RepID=A0A498R173_9FIRM|nr:Hypothetical protein LUCI_0111 [Lucifera butyrica]